jgi:hypothetical protein
MYECDICGYSELEEPPYDSHGCATFSVCPCCGTEFGYDDAKTSHAVLRQRWVAGGMRWTSSATAPPAGWEPSRQLLMADHA